MLSLAARSAGVASLLSAIGGIGRRRQFCLGVGDGAAAVVGGGGRKIRGLGRGPGRVGFPDVELGIDRLPTLQEEII